MTIHWFFFEEGSCCHVAQAVVLSLNLISAGKTGICQCALLGLVFGQHGIEENLGFKNILHRGLNSKFAMNSRNLVNFFHL